MRGDGGGDALSFVLPLRNCRDRVGVAYGGKHARQVVRGSGQRRFPCESSGAIVLFCAAPHAFVPHAIMHPINFMHLMHPM